MDQVRRFPADQVILLDEKRELEVRFDDAMKTINLPFWQAEAVNRPSRRTNTPALFADSFVPVVDQDLRVRGRLDQRIGLLRHVEAIRLHAAEHDGACPQPSPRSPYPCPSTRSPASRSITRLGGNTAHLRGTPPSGMEKDASYRVHYEVILRK